VIIEQLFGEPAAVVIAGTEEQNCLHLFVLGDQLNRRMGRYRPYMYLS
jgi:hypothetical protein